MKRITLILALSACVTVVNAQSSSGLVAHWGMNGGATDATGNGHDGTATDVTSAVGIDGLPNTAYYFNGATSKITVGYQSDLQLTKYSICAIVKVTGFNTNLCQANTIIARGKLQTPGSYMLQFNDNGADGNDCFAFDSTQNCFIANAGATGSGSAGVHMWQYTPTMQRDTWYKVVATWDGTQYQIYVNDTLKTTLTSITGGAFGTSTDGIAIGLHTFDAGYQYPFKGYIDDIRLYNRVLADTEIVHYGDPCGSVTIQPVNVADTAGSTVKFSVVATLGSPTYQWQQNTGTGFVDLSDAGIYSGVHTDTLTVAGITPSMNNYLYKCKVSNWWACEDMSDSAKLTIGGVGVKGLVTEDMISVVPNPVHSQLNITTASSIEGCDIQIINTVGQIVVKHELIGNSTSIDVSMLPTSLYVIKISSGDAVFYKRIIKN